MSTWMETTVESVRHWHSGLLSLRINSPHFSFKAGQFARIGLPGNDGEPLARAYSMVSAPGTETLEFVIAVVPDGDLSPRLAKLQAGDRILLNSHPSGFFTLDHVPEGETLWLLATGTGIGPYLSILKGEQVWQNFRRIRLVHGVRSSADLCYRDWLQALQQKKPQQFYYQPVLSREHHQHQPTMLHGRIPALVDSGELEHACKAVFNSQAQIMLCGNPAMIQDARTALKAKGLEKHLRRKPGNITMEQYWA
ncbi:ferredoxin--NADP reductase [Aliidiomarina soli]|uniref:ferredoxin--NADP(+) reductase n=1 Tax=Aliidiomarina soli TaxID=1928574 RepID=A0A432WFP8_9GAMM|nr:ferredoxin--NADP reductase [Aliidiomarina soli]RUO32529.1 ferredoxin--NADP(+) reductase [Aliidiomarina soli]